MRRARAWRQYRKAIAFVAGCAAQLVADGMIDGTAADYVRVALAALTLAGIVKAPNEKRTPVR